MIILNLFIGIIMNSMTEMHAEIEERDRARHEQATRAATVEDEFRLLERQMKDLQAHLAALRRRCLEAEEARRVETSHGSLGSEPEQSAPRSRMRQESVSHAGISIA
jgi:hypothetical protein